MSLRPIELPVLGWRKLGEELTDNLDQIRKIGCFYLEMQPETKALLYEIMAGQIRFNDLNDGQKDKVALGPANGFQRERGTKESYFYWMGGNNPIPCMDGFNTPSFEKYSDKLVDLSHTILRELFKDILPTESIREILTHPTRVLRLIKYLPEKEILSDDHTDYGLLTFLHTTGSGLQIFVGDKYYNVLNKPGYLIVNFGDMMSKLSHGKINNVIHRVMNHHCKKTSVVLFVDPNAAFNINGKEYKEILEEKIIDAME